MGGGRNRGNMNGSGSTRSDSVFMDMDTGARIMHTQTTQQSLIGWTPHPTIKLLVGPTKEPILIHGRIIKELNLALPEKQDSAHQPIQIPNVDPQCLKILLNYIYNDEFHITVENVWNILVTCWQFTHLTAQTLCVDFIADNMNSFDCWEMWRSANLYHITELVLAIENYTSRNLETLKSGESFLNLSYEEILSYFKSEEVCRSSSRELRFRSGIAWIEHDVVAREQYVSNLILETNLHDLPPATQHALITQHSVLARNSEMQKYLNTCNDFENHCPITLSLNIFDDPDITIEDVVVKIERDDRSFNKEIGLWPSSKECISLDSDDDTVECNVLPPKKDTLIIVSDKINSGKRTVWSYDVQTKRKSVLTTVEARNNDCFLCRNNTLYHLGGQKEGVVTNQVMSLNLAEKKLAWKACPSMKVPRCFFSSILLNGDIFAIGGNIGTEKEDMVINSVDKLAFDEGVAHEEWETMGYMNRGRDAYGVAVLDNKIFVTGGCGQMSRHCKHSTVLQWSEEYDSDEDCWSSSRRMNQKRMHHVMVTLKGRIYAIGGYDRTFNNVLSTMESYDGTETGKWTYMAPMRTARKEMSAVVYNDCIYVIGGKDEKDKILNNCEVYNPSLNSWDIATIFSEDEGPFHFVLLKL